MLKFSTVLTVASLVFLFGCTRSSVSVKGSVPGDEGRRAKPATLWIATTRLTAATGKMGNGFAEATYTDDKNFTLTVRVNLVPLGRTVGGGRYEGWLLSADHIVKAGVLQSPKGDGTYFLTFQKQEDLRGYGKILITQEPPQDEHPDAPHEEILRGTFTVVASAAE